MCSKISFPDDGYDSQYTRKLEKLLFSLSKINPKARLAKPWGLKSNPVGIKAQ